MPSEISVTKLPKLELPTIFCDGRTFGSSSAYLYTSEQPFPSRTRQQKTGLTDHYDEAIKCLKESPRQIHQTHVRHIVEVRTGKSWLKSLGHEPSLLEMKLDSTTMFEWQSRTPKLPTSVCWHLRVYWRHFATCVGQFFVNDMSSHGGNSTRGTSAVGHWILGLAQALHLRRSTQNVCQACNTATGNSRWPKFSSCLCNHQERSTRS